MHKYKKYIEYDPDDVFDIDISKMQESRIEHDLKQGKIKKIYATKIIEMNEKDVDVEIYPEFTRKKQITNKSPSKKKAKEKRLLNDRSSSKYLVRLIQSNFKTGDIFATLTCDESHIPKDYNDAHKMMTLYIQRLNYERKKRNLEKAKYIYVISHSSKSKVRWHFHLFVDGKMEMDLIESKWKAGRRNQTRRLQEDDDGLKGIALYFAKQVSDREKNQKRWGASVGLKKPKERKNHYMFRGSHVKKIVKDNTVLKRVITKRFPDADIRQVKIYFNDFNGQYYVQASLRRKGVMIKNE